MQPTLDPIPWLRLARLPSIGPILTLRLLEKFHTPDAILNAHPAALAAVEGIGTHRASQITAAAPKTTHWAVEELARATQHNIHLIPLADPRYPPALKTITDPPILLYAKGNLQPHDTVALAIVGARRCTLYGREQAARFGHDLAKLGFAVISGGARGIDTCAHQGALRANGRTVVVQGCGLLNTYPPENDALYTQITAEENGVILSELPLETPPTPENFPPRNRIIAGMSLGVVVIEANLRSGSLITARLAAADYGREVFALPGRVDSPASAGTHHLLKTGSAHLVESAQDVLPHLGDIATALQPNFAAPSPPPSAAKTPQSSLFPAASPPQTPRSSPQSLTSVQQKIVAALDADPADLDTLIDRTELPPAVVMAELTLLELQSTVRRHPGNTFARR